MDFTALRNDTQRRLRQDDIIERFYRTYLSGNGDVIDGGASYGRHTGPLVEVASRSRVVAFEPIPDLADDLDHQVKIMGLNNRCIVRNQALGARREQRSFTYFDELNSNIEKINSNSFYSSLCPRNIDLLSRRFREIFVEVTDVDTVGVELSLNIQFMKLDLEGGEYDALRGSEKTIRSNSPIIVFEDSGPDAATRFGYKDQDFIDILLDHQYNLYYISGHKVDRHDWLSRNVSDRWRPINIFAWKKSLISEASFRQTIDLAHVDAGLSPLWHTSE